MRRTCTDQVRVFHMRRIEHGGTTHSGRLVSLEGWDWKFHPSLVTQVLWTY